MTTPVELNADEVRELRLLIEDVDTNPYCSGELHAIGGVRAVLSDSTLTKLGFELLPLSPKAALTRSLNTKETP
jgi:hypothetical protein